MAKRKPISALPKRRAAAAAVREPAPAGPALSTIGPAIAVGSLAGLTYANTLGHGLVWDDPISVQRWLPALPTWWSAFFPPPGIPQFPSDYYRPLQLLSYRVDRAIGGGAAWPFHLSVVLMHTLATVLVFYTGVRLFGRGQVGRWSALFAAGLFAVHPIHSESVAWMAARPDVMVTCTGLGALLAFWNTTWSSWRRSIVAAALIFVGLLCKENAAALLIMVPTSLLVVSPGSQRGVTMPTVSSIVTLVPFVVAAAAYLILRTAGLGAALASDTVLPPNPLSTFFAAVGTYLRLLVFPYPQNAYIPDVATDTATLILSVLLISGVLASLWWAWQRNHRALLFALLWMLLTLAPSLFVIVKPPTAALAERYLYLPSAGFCWAAGALLAQLSERMQGRRVVTYVVADGLILVAFGVTIQRNQVWHDNLSLWTDTAAKNTVDGLPLRSLAAATLERGDSATAARLFQDALKLRNNARGEYTIYNNLGTLALNQNDDVTAEKHYRRALALQPSADCLFNLGLIQLRRGMNAELTPDADARGAKIREARALFEQAIVASPHDPDVHVALAQAAEALDDPATARSHFEQAIRLGLSPPVEAGVRQRLQQLK